jgi:hypothetical protein
VGHAGQNPKRSYLKMCGRREINERSSTRVHNTIQVDMRSGAGAGRHPRLEHYSAILKLESKVQACIFM